ncbi:hypothetical protein DPMN_041402 [Dreissena polymorpha]|uniref:Uncharacterized protein n=1 Tax=Dreissena polymorpha TaxID=45954 RepID=A0A9D4CX57_DREPO|nr:hypothetical protein DPMN_041402 [Dreissena polymorpha]
MAASKRFADTSSEEIANKRLKLNSQNTLRANKKCANILKSYLCEKDQSPDFESLEVNELAKQLRKVYMGLRKRDGGLNKTTSIESIKSGLNRYLHSPPYTLNIDIVKDNAFKDANKNCSVCKRMIRNL